MKISYEWLRAFVPLDSGARELRDLITAHTTTVDELVPLRTDLARIVIGRVVEAQHHPDSDHLWVTKVDAGGHELLEVVCGAPNVRPGALYPFAPTGTLMPNGMKIERRKIRGVVSNGMLCSARELGLGEDQQGILELDVSAEPGTPFLDAMPVGDMTLVLDVGANRPDLLSHLGVAREVSAVTGRSWQLPAIDGLPSEIPKAKRGTGSGGTAGVTITVDAPTRTPRYMGAVVRGVKIGPSPDWLVRRLQSVGVRAINNVVDATNYVLHELGQPIHAFDLAKLKDRVVVRLARPGEKLVTLDGVTRELPAGGVVIADARASQAVAGVMGGRESEVTDATTDLFIEVASFDPHLTRATRKAIGLVTDASYRFERGVDPELAPMAMDRVVRIILSVAGGTLADAPADVTAELPNPREVPLRASRIAQVLGEPVPLQEARAYLERAGFVSVSGDGTRMSVRVPSWRSDICGEIDLIEDIARFRGYGSFPDEIRPFRPTTTWDDPLWTMADRVRATMVGLGFLEARPMPWVPGHDGEHVRISNPLAETEAFLRRSLLETLAHRAEFNLAQRTGDVRLFEIGATFTPTRGRPEEELRLGVVMMGRRRPAHFTEPNPPVIDEWDAKGVAETAARVVSTGGAVVFEDASSEERSSGVLWRLRDSAAGLPVGDVRRLRLDAPVWAAPAFAIELRIGRIPSEAPAGHGDHAYAGTGLPASGRVPKYRTLPTMPAAEFDLALLVPRNVTVADVERVIRASSGELLEKLELFDQYTGAGIDVGHRSLAWRLTFRHAERTLRDKEIEGRRAKILGALEQELHVRQRTA